MSRMNLTCHGSSLNDVPCPVPLGIVRRSMKSMTALARCLPAAVRSTLPDEARELRGFFVAGNPSGNSAPGDWGTSEFDGIAGHVGRSIAGNQDQGVALGDVGADRALDRELVA